MPVSRDAEMLCTPPAAQWPAKRRRPPGPAGQARRRAARTGAARRRADLRGWTPAASPVPGSLARGTCLSPGRPRWSVHRAWASSLATQIPSASVRPRSGIWPHHSQSVNYPGLQSEAWVRLGTATARRHYARAVDARHRLSRPGRIDARRSRRREYVIYGYPVWRPGPPRPSAERRIFRLPHRLQ